MKKLIDNFGGCFVSIRVYKEGVFLEFAGLLVDSDSLFCYLDTEGAGSIDTVININQIFMIQMGENAEIEEMPEGAEELDNMLSLLDIDDDDGGKIQ